MLPILLHWWTPFDNGNTLSLEQREPPVATDDDELSMLVGEQDDAGASSQYNDAANTIRCHISCWVLEFKRPPYAIESVAR